MTRWSRSAIRSASTAPSPPASSARSSGRSPPRTASRSITCIQTDAPINHGNSGRPADRRARRGDRGQLRRSRPARRLATATSASASRSRRTRSRASSPRSSRTARSSTPTSASRCRRSSPTLARRLQLARLAGVLIQTVQPGSARRRRPASRRATNRRRRRREHYIMGGDLIVGVDGNAGARRSTSSATCSPGTSRATSSRSGLPRRREAHVTVTLGRQPSLSLRSSRPIRRPHGRSKPRPRVPASGVSVRRAASPASTS